jgi:hypothetical protein
MIIPDVELGYLPVCRGERLRRVPICEESVMQSGSTQVEDEPFDVILQVEIIAFLAQLFWEGMLSPLLRVGDVAPFSQGTAHSDAVVVDLITASDHDMERSLGMAPEHIIPERRAAPRFLVRPDAEAIAGMEHDPERLRLGRHVEVPEIPGLSLASMA